jgi:putative redox protein
VKARIKWLDGMAFVGEADSGHGVVMDAAPDIGGRNIGLRPMEMLLLGLGGCTAIDVMLILKRGREAIADCAVEIEAERASEDPKIFTRIHLVYRLKGKSLSGAKIERAIALSKEKYCSATIMLQASVAITHEWVLEPLEG